tara:strand:- start:7325 stop:7462 length:138 start_codon:yes stop_codon:yes gene_type:complete
MKKQTVVLANKDNDVLLIPPVIPFAFQNKNNQISICVNYSTNSNH